jgi:chorismate mutase/prephenate dehydratase
MIKAYEDTTGTVVAIGCEESGLIYKLNAIQRNIANQKHNITRFIVVGKQEVCVPNDALAKTSIIFSTENKPGALVNVLNVFSKHNINICKLQSRPRSPNDTKNNAIWAETFYADIQINTNSTLMQNILKELQSFTGFVKILGCYEQNTQN